MAKRTLSLLLALAMVLSLGVGAFADEGDEIAAVPAESEVPAEAPAEPEAEEVPAPAEPEADQAPEEEVPAPVEPETEEEVPAEEPVPEEEATAAAEAPMDEPAPAAEVNQSLPAVSSGTCGLNGSTSLTWKLENNDDYLTSENSYYPSYTLTISGTGPMEDFVMGIRWVCPGAIMTTIFTAS